MAGACETSSRKHLRGVADCETMHNIWQALGVPHHVEWDSKGHTAHVGGSDQLEGRVLVRRALDGVVLVEHRQPAIEVSAVKHREGLVADPRLAKEQTNLSELSLL